MNGYVVFYCGESDDIPVFLSPNQGDAFTLAEDLASWYDDHDGHHPKVAAAINGISRGDIGTFVTIAVATFKDGQPVDWDAMSVREEA